MSDCQSSTVGAMAQRSECRTVIKYSRCSGTEVRVSDCQSSTVGAMAQRSECRTVNQVQ